MNGVIDTLEMYVPDVIWTKLYKNSKTVEEIWLLIK